MTPPVDTELATREEPLKGWQKTTTATKFCEIEDCDDRLYARKMCAKHYARLLRKGPLTKQTLEERLFAQVNKTEDGCWEWTGVCDSNGRGKMSIHNKERSTHRLSWELHNGPIPDGLLVCHKCDNPPCLRPDHLFLGTQKDNMQDAIKKGRMAWQKDGTNG